MDLKNRTCREAKCYQSSDQSVGVGSASELFQGL